MTGQDALKYQAAIAALDEVRPGMVIGLGTGSTVTHFIRELGVRVREGLTVTAIPTSIQSERLAREAGIPLSSFIDHKVLDLTVDGADEVSPDLQLVKGLGGALVREKIVAKVSRRLVIVVDETKLVDQLGTRSPVPVEVVTFAEPIVADQLARIGGEPEIRSSGGMPFVSDNGNHVIDWHIGPIADPVSIELRVKSITGVVDSGLFVNLAQRVIVAGGAGLRVLDKGTR